MKKEFEFDFLRALTLDALREEDKNLSYELNAWDRSVNDSTNIKGSEFENMRLLFSVLDNNPISPKAPKFAVSLQQQVLKCEADLGALQIHIRANRSQLMLACIRPWRWVDVDVANAVKERLVLGMDASHVRGWDWLDDMMSVAETALETRSQIIVFDPRTRKAFAAISDTPYTYRMRRVIVYDDHNQDQKRSTILQIILESLPVWLGFGGHSSADDRENRMRAWFVEIVHQRLGSKFLTTDIAWKAFMHFKASRYIIDNNIYRSHCPGRPMLAAFEDSLCCHPVLIQGTEEHASLNQYKEKFYGNSLPVPYMYATTDYVNDVFITFYRFIAFAYTTVAGRVKPETAEEELVLQDPERHHPLREQSISRIRSRSCEGPYHPEFVRSTQGLFSAAVWRGLTYRTTFSQNTKMQFWDVGHILTTVRIHGSQARSLDSEEASTYYCRKDVYGTYISTRSMDQVQTFWERISQSAWPSFCETPHTFAQCSQFIRNVNVLDEFSLYELVCDMAYAGVCDAPNEEDVSQYIVRTNPLAYEQLREMGFVNYAADRLAETMGALKSVVRQFTSNSFAAAKGRIEMDLVGAEYALRTYRSLATLAQTLE